VSFEPCCLATGIGSLPHTEPARAMELVSSAIPEIPYVPQLPAMSWHEAMLVQYTEGLPGRVLDERNEKLYVDTEQGLLELEEFYTRVIEDDPEKFPISEDHLHGLSGLIRLLERRPDLLSAVKTQVTGPVTQGLSTVDQDRRSVFYNDTFQEVVVKSCALKARWMLRRLRPFHSTLLCFVDEPVLSAFGSSVYVSIRREEVIGQLAEVGSAIRQEGALCGVHCCGNTDWTLLTEAGVDIISFDAFEFAYSLPLYPEAITTFLERGGIIAWGVVPTSAEVKEQSAESLSVRLEEAIAGIEKLGVSRRALLRQALITPACGLGTTDEGVAEAAFHLLREVSLIMREKAASASV